MSGNAKRNHCGGHHGGAGVRGGGTELEILRRRRPLQQAEETGTKILGEAALVSGQDGEQIWQRTRSMRGTIISPPPG